MSDLSCVSDDDTSQTTTACNICLSTSGESWLLTASELQQSVQETDCQSCHLVYDALNMVEERYDLRFTEVHLKDLWSAVDENLDGLRAQFKRIHDSSKDGLLRNSIDLLGKHRGFKLSLNKGEGLWTADATITISTPNFEIFLPGEH